MGLGNAYPVRAAVPDTFEIFSRFTGGGAGEDLVVADGDWNKGIESVEYDGATGKYLITFTDVGYQIIHAIAVVHRPTTADDPQVGNIRLGAYDRDAKTVPVEFGATLFDIDTDEIVTFHFVWARQAPKDSNA